MSGKSQPSVGLLKQALVIAERIQQLEGELAAILSQGGDAAPAAVEAVVRRGPGRPRKKARFSAAARASISAAQRARWAKIKKDKGEPVVAKEPKKRKKPKFSPEARERIAAAQRKRWAKIRKAK